jgi:hypothetical protein
LKYLFRYFKRTRTKDIIYKFNLNPAIIINEDTINIIGYSDFDWVNDSFINYFTTEYIFMSAENSLIWKSKKQFIVVLSSCEVKYIAALYIIRVTIWLRNLINEIEFIILIISPSILIAIDNQKIIAIIKIDALNRRTKYINIRYYHFREYTKQDIIDPYYIPTSKILTNGFIKTLGRLKFATFTTSIGMHG